MFYSNQIKITLSKSATKINQEHEDDLVIYKSRERLRTLISWQDSLMSSHFYGWVIDSDSNLSWTSTLKETCFLFLAFSATTFWKKWKMQRRSLRPLTIVDHCRIVQLWEFSNNPLKSNFNPTFFCIHLRKWPCNSTTNSTHSIALGSMSQVLSLA